jgi:DNA-binding transcriptional LysR family regulator
MNIVQLEAFVAVVDRGSFSAAARALGLSQPAVTMQIQQLEADLGVTLLLRGPRASTPTEAGEELLPRARAILAALVKAREAMQGMADHVSGHLLVGASTTPGQYVLPRLLGSFLELYPDVGVTLQVGDTVEVVEAVADRSVAIGMVGAEVKGFPVAFEAAGTDDVVLIAPPGDVILGATRAADLERSRFVVREQGSGTRSVTEATLKAAGLDPSELDVVLELGTGEAIVNAVEGGLGIGAVSHWAAEKALALGTVQTVSVAGFPVRRGLYLVIPRGPLPRAAEAFADHVREALGGQSARS